MFSWVFSCFRLQGLQIYALVHELVCLYVCLFVFELYMQVRFQKKKKNFWGGYCICINAKIKGMVAQPRPEYNCRKPLWKLKGWYVVLNAP